MKPSARYSLLTLLAVLCVGVALSATRLKLPAFTQSAGEATRAQPALGWDDTDSSANADRTVVVQTDKADYAPGEAIVVTGGGWDPGEAVTLLLHEEPTIHPDRRVAVVADASGNIFDNQFTQDAHDRGVMLQLTATGRTSGLSTQAMFGNPSATLSQWANLTNTWVSGNLGSSKAEYFEGDSIPYRLTFGSLSLASHSVTIEWDTTKGDKHALDYITTFNRSVPHVPPAPTVPGEAPVDPCAGVSPCGSLQAYGTSNAIPADSQVTGAGVTPIAGNFSIYGGTITAISGYSGGATFPTGDNSRRITITFTASQANPVLAWGAHIATRVNWGLGYSAVAIPGSPFHTRLIDLDGAGGNQDRSLSSDATVFPGSITIIKDAVPNGTLSFSFTASPPPLGNFSLVDNPPNADDNHTKIFSAITNFTTYTVAETTVSGWTLSLASPPCVLTSPNGGGSSASGSAVTINMKEGENYTCTFTNSRQNATLTVIKHVINDNGGGKSASDFQMTVTGASPSPATFSGVESPGTSVSITPGAGYDVTETGPSGYTETDSSGCHSTTGLPAGGSATCTITNDDIQPKLHVIKALGEQQYGDTKTIGNFSLHVKGSGVDVSGSPHAGQASPGTLYNLNAGTYVVSEDAVAGYSSAITGACNASTGAVTLSVGDDVTCTITNTAVQPKLHVIKALGEQYGDTKTIGNFNLHVKGSGVDVSGSPHTGQASPGTLYNLNAGTYVVSEDAVAGYNSAMTGACNASTGAVTLSLGDDVTCTITNTAIQPKLHVIKALGEQYGDTKAIGNFSLHVKGSGVDVGGSPHTGEASPGTLYNLNAGTYVVSETAVAGYGSAMTGACDASTGAVTLSVGDDVTCTITNTAVQPKLHVVKVVSGGSSVAGDFSLHVKSGSSDVAGSPKAGAGVPGTEYNLNAGTYTVSEDAITGYTGAFAGACDSSGQVVLHVGDDVTCTVTNTYAKAGPAVTTAMSWTLKDEAIVTGIRRGPACGGPATVTFRLYRFDLTATDFSDCSAEGVTEINLSNPVVTLVYDDPAESSTTGRASMSSDVTTEGIYVWTAEYSGDDCNNPRAAVCGKERTTITQVNTTP